MTQAIESGAVLNGAYRILEEIGAGGGGLGRSDGKPRGARLVGRGVDERSDVYSLGATLYHLLTDVKPGHDFEAIQPLAAYGVRVSKGLNHIVTRMMALEPEKRYRDGAELLSALRNIYELDSGYRAFHRRRLLQKIVITMLYAAGAALLVFGTLRTEREMNTSYNREITQAQNYTETGDFAPAAQTIAEARLLLLQRIEAYRQETLRLYRQRDYDACIAYAL